MLKIETGENNKILRTVCKPVTDFDDSLRKLVADMEEAMLEEDKETKVKGVGLAAPQVGIDKRLMLVTFNVNSRKENKVIVMINPEIVDLSKKTICLEEGCLSLPNQFAKVTRPAKIKARWQNLDENWCEKKLDKWDARIFLHEFDHLEGILFIDYL
ncbi:peptide deformylase [Candidatus Gracilibacteria bacterium]|nr:peptide deformylase [Candidatus Gracilibacteria bacterium]